MRISERVDNAIRAMGEIAAAGDDAVVKADHIAQRQDISVKYLLDILGELKRARLLRSRRGPDGGFALARDSSQITLADIFRAVDGPLADVHDESLRELSYLAPTESLVEVWMAVRASLRRVLESVTLADLVSGDLPDPVGELATEYLRQTAERHG